MPPGGAPVSPYVALNAVLIGLYGFSAIYHVVLWSQSRREFAARLRPQHDVVDRREAVESDEDGVKSNVGAHRRTSRRHPEVADVSSQSRSRLSRTMRASAGTSPVHE